jgi:hypothetical protein
MPKSESKRKISKKDLAVYSAGGAKEGGRLHKVGVALNVPKKAPKSEPQPKAKRQPDAKVVPVLAPQLEHWKDVDKRSEMATKAKKKK